MPAPSPSGLSFIILTILARQTPSTRFHRAKTTATPRPTRTTTWDLSVCLQVEAAVTKADGTHPAMSHGADPLTGATLALKPNPQRVQVSVQVKDCLNDWLISQTLNQLTHQVMAP